MDNTEFVKATEGQETKASQETKAPQVTNTISQSDNIIKMVDKTLNSMKEEANKLHAKLTDDVSKTIDQLLTSYQTSTANMQTAPKTKEQEILDEMNETFYPHTYFRKNK